MGVALRPGRHFLEGGEHAVRRGRSPLSGPLGTHGPVRHLAPDGVLEEVAIEEAEHRLATLIRYLMEVKPTTSPDYRVPFTRQQLADMTGLRVETVIRTVKSMESKGVLRIVSGRILWNSEAAEAHYGRH